MQRPGRGEHRVSTSRRTPRWAALGATATLVLSGLSVIAPGSATAAPAPAPVSLSPDSGSVLKDVELTWAPVQGATSYEVQLMDDENADVATTFNATSPIARYTVPTTLPVGEYLWRVRSLTGTTPSAWSRMATLERGWEDAATARPTADGSVLPQLSWSPIPGASFYEVEVNPVSFRSPEYAMDKSFVCRTQQTTFTPYGVAVGAGTVFSDPPGDQSSCAFGVLTSAEAKAAAEKRIKEAEEAEAAKRANPTPTPSADPTATPTATPTAPAVAEPIPDPSADTTYIYGRKYFWRVRGRDGTVDERTTPFVASPGSCVGPWQRSGVDVTTDPAGGGLTATVQLPTTHDAPTTTPECSRWSGQQTFTVPGLGAGVVDVAPSGLSVTPLRGGSSSRVTASPSFAWAPVAGAFYYRFYLSRDRQIGSVDFASEIIATTITPVSSLGLGSTTRYWAVQACGIGSETVGDRNCGPITAPQPISQVTANPATPESVVSEATHLQATWRTGAVDRSAAKAYEVRLTNTETGVATLHKTDRVSTDLRGGRSTLSFPSATMAEGTYAFSVRPLDEGDRATAWSPRSQTAVIDRTAPTASILTKPGYVDHDRLVIGLSEPVTGVDASTLGVVSATGARVAGTLTAISRSKYAFTPSSPWTTGGYARLWSGAVVDRAGKRIVPVTSLVRGSTGADSAGEALRFRSGDHAWTARTSSDAVGRSYLRSQDDARTGAKASAAVTVYGTSVSVRACKSPTSGSVQVWVDGRLRTTASLYRSWTGCANQVTVGGLGRGLHQVVVVGVSTAGRGETSIDQVSTS